MGYKPGPIFSEILRSLEDAQLEGEIENGGAGSGTTCGDISSKEEPDASRGGGNVPITREDRQGTAGRSELGK